MSEAPIAQPGPWHVSEMTMEKKAWSGLNDGKTPVTIVRANWDGWTGDVVAVVWCGDDYDELKTANLIAAVPDLDRELAHLVRLLEPLEREGSLNVPGLATLNGARAALAKARGEQS